MPEALRLAYASAKLSNLGHLLIQESLVRDAAKVARRAARATFDPDAADALNAAASALDGAAYTVQSAAHVVRSECEDAHQWAHLKRTE